MGESIWSKANHALIKDTTYRVINLIEHQEYEFRAAAVNAAGQGAWSDPSENIKCISFRKCLARQPRRFARLPVDPCMRGHVWRENMYPYIQTDT